MVFIKLACSAKRETLDWKQLSLFVIFSVSWNDIVLTFIYRLDILQIFLWRSLGVVIPVKYKCYIIGSGNGLAPIRRQAIIWTNAHPVHWRIYGTLREDQLMPVSHTMIWPNADLSPIGMNVSEPWVKIQNISPSKIHLRMLSAICQQSCPGVTELKPSASSIFRSQY